MKYRTFGLISFLAAALVACPAPPTYEPAKDPFYAGGTGFGDQIPTGATVVSVEEFKQQFDTTPSAEFLTKAKLEALIQVDQIRIRQNETLVIDHVAQKPEFASWLLADEDGSINSDSDHSRLIQTNKGISSITTLGRKARLASFASQLRTFQTQENQLGIYKANLQKLIDYFNEALNGDFTLEQ